MNSSQIDNVNGDVYSEGYEAMYNATIYDVDTVCWLHSLRTLNLCVWEWMWLGFIVEYFTYHTG